ncbi:MAG: tRNA lysidine(34) synthetase TilS [Bacteroidota bacterium]|jgi:tRNA(Ile)-lysidine synthase
MLGIHAEQKTPVLLALSGGLDSTVMAFLFHRAGIPCAVAHVHYGLRGAESVGDMQSVQELAARLNMPCHLSDASAFMQGVPKAEIQQAARQWRYRVFGEWAQAHGYGMVALAHHRDDQEEHFWMYRKRGNMLSALAGMSAYRPFLGQEIHTAIVRPLLFATKAELLAYAQSEGISWREDHSNASPDYTRNKFRLQVIPELKKEDSAAYAGFATALALHREVFAEFRTALRRLDARFVRLENNHEQQLNRESILKAPLGLFWLKQYLASFGFHPDLVMRVHAAGFKNGLRFRGKGNWELFTHRDGWFLMPCNRDVATTKYLSKEQSSVNWMGQEICIQLLPVAVANTLPRNPSMFHFDAEGLEWPLMLRSVQPGDRMVRFSGGHTKVSDVFSNLSIPVFKRPLLPLLYSGAELLCIPGLIRSGALKVTDYSKTVLVVSLRN